MLQLRNESPFRVHMAVLPNADAIDTLYVAAKATFRLGARGVDVADAQVPVQLADVYRAAPEVSSLAAACEVHVEKPSTDIVLLGDAVAPGGKPVPSLDVSLAVGPLKKTVRVFGDRVFSGALGDRASSPAPFVTMPLLFERAFGGIVEIDPESGAPRRLRANPSGIGFAQQGKGGPPGARALPNLEDPRALIASPSDRPPPAAFAFVAPFWDPRAALAGTFDEAWKERRAPYLPEDFDPRHLQAAVPDLVAPAPLRGGEPVDLRNVSPDGPLVFPLPRCDLLAAVRIAGRTETPLFRLETVLFEPALARFSLLFRAALPCDKKILAIDEVRVSLRRLDLGGARP